MHICSIGNVPYLFHLPTIFSHKNATLPLLYSFLAQDMSVFALGGCAVPQYPPASASLRARSVNFFSKKWRRREHMEHNRGSRYEIILLLIYKYITYLYAA